MNERGRILLLILVATAVWGYNMRLLWTDPSESEDEIRTDEAAPEHALPDLHDRIRLLAQTQAAAKLGATWEPFFRQDLTGSAEPPVEEEKPEAAPPPKPVPPFRLEYTGFIEGDVKGDARELFILRSSEGLTFLHLGDEIGPWQLVARDEEKLVFQDEAGNRRELLR
ncbi:hypothetical protein SCOR_30145 [Sulfidibacter corallicola]|uniref:Uncharacterized protein n=1 Tax=Sulfidibacter corallicola TaxID=2818388 RepID=A0A8A4TM45_SULCO|nr:hypothetical protein [Sulfidibacter corallicola]QTD50182.1 hypothetical protein J3U87_31745 [Sulfidibacter corallicola]